MSFLSPLFLLGVLAAAVWIAAEVIDDDFRAALREVQRIGAAETGAGACNQGYLPIKSNCHDS